MSTTAVIWIILSVYVYVVLRQTVYNRVYALQEIKVATDLGKLFGSYEKTAYFFERILQVKKESYYILLVWSSVVCIAFAAYRNWYCILFFIISISGYNLAYRSHVTHKHYKQELQLIAEKFDELVEKIENDKK